MKRIKGWKMRGLAALLATVFVMMQSSAVYAEESLQGVDAEPSTVVETLQDDAESPAFPQEDDGSITNDPVQRIETENQENKGDNPVDPLNLNGGGMTGQEKTSLRKRNRRPVKRVI